MNVTRVIHEASATSVDMRLRRAVLPLSPSTYCWGLAPFFLAPVPWPPRASLATRLSDFATNRHESCGLGACPSPAPRWTGQPARVVGSRRQGSNSHILGRRSAGTAPSVRAGADACRASGSRCARPGSRVAGCVGDLESQHSSPQIFAV